MKVDFTTNASAVDIFSEYCRYETTNPNPESIPIKSRFSYNIYFDRELNEDEIKSIELRFREFYANGFKTTKEVQNDC